jgi:hypothetical protein
MYIIERSDGAILPVTTLLDEQNQLTTDKDKAVSFVAKISDSEWISAYTDGFIIHTVH